MYKHLVDYYVFIAAICTSRGWVETSQIYIHRAHDYHNLMENEP